MYKGRVMEKETDKKQGAATTAKKAEAFVVIAFGYWGKGASLKEAADKCHKSGAGKRAKAVAYKYTGEPEALAKVTVTDSGTIEYPWGDVEQTRLFGLRDNTAKTIGEVIRQV